MSLIGNQTLFVGSRGSVSTNRKNVLQVAYPAGGGTIDRIDVNCDVPIGASSGTQKFKAVLYADSAGSPGALLATGGEVTKTYLDAQAWVSSSFSPVEVAASGAGSGVVWIGLISDVSSDGSTQIFAYFQSSGGTTTAGFNADTYSDGATNPFGVMTTLTRAWNFRAEFTSYLPACTVTPVIAPTAARVGETLTVTPGTYTGTPSPTVTRQWQRNGADIAGETGLTYIPTSLDLGQSITVLETATNTGGSTTGTSNAVTARPATNWRNLTAVA